MEDDEYEGGQAQQTEPVEPGEPKRQTDETERRLVSRLTKRIKEDRAHFKEPFEQMRKDAHIARFGAEPGYAKDAYKVNVTGRHINQKTAALYAKNPKAIARRRERMDFKIWDETEQSLMQALQVVASAEVESQVPGSDPGSNPMLNPAAAMMIQQSMDLVMDYQNGMMQKQRAEKIGKTLEILFHYFTAEQTPLDFKARMKQVVRRACTTGVGYVKLGFQREMEQNLGVSARLADFRTQIAQIQMLMNEVQENEGGEELEVRKREAELAMQSLQQQEYILIREGLVFDFPKSTQIIPDKMCDSLQGFSGARWLTVEHLYTPEEVKRNFGVELGKGYKAYSDDGTIREIDEPEFDFSGGEDEKSANRSNLVCVWEHYDRETGTVYILCDGYKGFLKDPGAPDVYVEDFWPVYALTFNEVEDEKCLFPPSDVQLMFDMQRAYNAARQGQREHRRAARPRFVSPTGLFSDEDKEKLATCEPFEVLDINVPPETDIRKAIQPIPMPGVDPNLYETGTTMTDIQLAVGSQEAQFGAVAKATATESSIAESSRIASVDSNVDDLDSFLSKLARASGQILLKEMSEQEVMRIVGPGAVWPPMTLQDIAEEIVLEIEAGSSGKPNQAQEIRNWREMLPFLVQMPNIAPTWLARETLRRLDDRMDLTDAITENVPAIVAQNRLATQAGAGAPAPAPGASPEDQGGAGADNQAEGPQRPGGSDAPGANNQQRIM